MAGHDGGGIAHAHAIFVQIGLRRACQHHAGAVVAVKDQRLFQRTLRQHDLSRADPPHPFARGIGGRVVQVIRQPLAKTHHVLVIIADGRGPRHQPHPGGAQAAHLRLDPVPGRLAVDLHGRIGQQRSAHFGVLVNQGHIRAGLRRSQGGGNARSTRADDQHVGVQIAAGIAVGVSLGRRLAQARRAPDHGFIDLVPEGLRPHEGLVVEPGREQHIGPVVDRAQVKGQVRPLVLAFRDQARAQFLDSGARVGFKPPRTARGADQRIRFLGSSRHRAARAVILEGPAHQVDAVGQQRRGERACELARDRRFRAGATIVTMPRFDLDQLKDRGAE